VLRAIAKLACRSKSLITPLQAKQSRRLHKARQLLEYLEHIGDERGAEKTPGAITIDSQGRIFVGDRSNNRFQYVGCQALAILKGIRSGFFLS
jgi:hypothetical protein